MENNTNWQQSTSKQLTISCHQFEKVISTKRSKLSQGNTFAHVIRTVCLLFINLKKYAMKVRAVLLTWHKREILSFCNLWLMFSYFLDYIKEFHLDTYKSITTWAIYTHNACYFLKLIWYLVD